MALSPDDVVTQMAASAELTVEKIMNMGKEMGNTDDDEVPGQAPRTLDEP